MLFKRVIPVLLVLTLLPLSTLQFYSHEYASATNLSNGIPAKTIFNATNKSFDFNFTATTGKMTVIGVRMNTPLWTNAKINETLFDDEAQITMRAMDIADFNSEDSDVSLILINGNEIPAEKLMFLNVTLNAVMLGDADVLMKNESTTVPTGGGNLTGSFNESDFFDIYTFSAASGDPVDINVDFGTSTDLQVYIYSPTNNKYYSRSQALIRADYNPDGVLEDATFVAPSSGVYTAVVTNVGSSQIADYNIVFTIGGINLTDGLTTRTHIDIRDTIEYFRFVGKKDSWNIIESRLEASNITSAEYVLRLRSGSWTVGPEIVETVNMIGGYGLIIVNGFKLSADTTFFLEVNNTNGASTSLSMTLNQAPTVLENTTKMVNGSFEAGELTEIYQISVGTNTAFDINLTVPTNNDYDQYLWAPEDLTYYTSKMSKLAGNSSGSASEDISFISPSGGTYLVMVINNDTTLKSGGYSIIVSIDGRDLTGGKTLDDAMLTPRDQEEYFQAVAVQDFWNLMVQKRYTSSDSGLLKTEIYDGRYQSTALYTSVWNTDLEDHAYTQSIVMNGHAIDKNTPYFFRESGSNIQPYKVQFITTASGSIPNVTGTTNVVLNAMDLAVAYNISLASEDYLTLELAMAGSDNLDLYLFEPNKNIFMIYDDAVDYSTWGSGSETIYYDVPVDGAGDYLVLITNEGLLKAITTTLEVTVEPKDREPPVIEHTPITTFDPLGYTYIECVVTDNIEPYYVNLYYMTNLDDWNYDYMSYESSNDTYYTEVGDWDPGTSDLYYYIWARDYEYNCATYPAEDPKTNAIHLHVELDTEAPVISHFSQSSAPSDTALTIVAYITDNVAVTEAKLYYRTTGGFLFSELEMVDNIWDWEATIPGISVISPGIEYYLWATDGMNEVTAPSNAPLGLYTVDVEPPDTESPVIDLSSVPSKYKAGENLDIIVHVTDSGGIDTVVLSYKYKDEDTFMGWKTITMTTNGGGDYKATFKPESGKKSIQYYIRATDLASNSAMQPTMGPLDPKTIEEEKSTVPNTVLGGSMVAIVVIIVLVLIAVIAIVVIALRGKKDQVPPQTQSMQPLPPATGGVGYAPYQQSVVQTPPAPQAPPPPSAPIPPSQPTPDERPPEGPPPDLPPGAWQAPYQIGPPPSY